MSAACAYYVSAAYFNATLPRRITMFGLNSLKENDYQMWRQQYQRRIDEEKADDPKTFIGWALKGFIK